MVGAEVGAVLGGAGPGAEQVLVLEGGIERSQAEAVEDAAGGGASAGAGLDDVGAGGAFGVLEDAVFLNDERAAERDHEEDAEVAADQRQHEDAEVLEIEAEEDERGQGEDDAGGDGLAGVAGGLDDDGFENRGLALVAQEADGDDRDGDGGGHRETGAQAHVDRDPAEDDAEDGAQQDGAEGEFGAVFVGRDEGAESGLLFRDLLSFGHGASGVLRDVEISLKGECSSQEAVCTVLENSF